MFYSWAKIFLAVSSFFYTVHITAGVSGLVHTVPGDFLLHAGLNTAFVASFALFLAVVLIGTSCIAKLLEYLCHIPFIAGSIIGGIILGPSGLHIAGYALFSEPFVWIDTHTHVMYKLIPSDMYVFFIVLLSAALTVSYLLWLAGYETNIKDLMKVGVTAVAAGVLGALLPIVCIGSFLYYFFPATYTLISASGIGLVFAATSVSIPVAMLVSMQKMHLKSSQATLGAAIVDDIVAVVLVSLFMMMVQMGVLGDIPGMPDHALETAHHSGGLGAALGLMVLCAVVMVAVGIFVMPTLLAVVGRPSTGHFMALAATSAMLLYFAFAEMVGGLAGITGAYFAGLFHRAGDKQHKAEKTIAPFINSILLPLFLGSIGLQLNICVLSCTEWILACVLLVFAIISKLAACYIATKMSAFLEKRTHSSWTLLEIYLFGSSMVARGEVGLVIATLFKGAHIITAQSYVLCVVVIVLTTIATPVLLSCGFSLEKQSQESVSDAEYECVVRSSHALTIDMLFQSILYVIEKKNGIATARSISKGRTIIDLEGKRTRVILDPQKGVIFEGKQAYIESVIMQVKQELQNEINHIL